MRHRGRDGCGLRFSLRRREEGRPRLRSPFERAPREDADLAVHTEGMGRLEVANRLLGLATVATVGAETWMGASQVQELLDLPDLARVGTAMERIGRRHAFTLSKPWAAGAPSDWLARPCGASSRRVRGPVGIW